METFLFTSFPNISMEDALFQNNPWWEKEYKSGSIPRTKYLENAEYLLEKRDVIFITGLRRIGKSVFMKQIIEGLLKRKVPPEKILYVPCDGYSFKHNSLHDIIREYRKLKGLKYDEKFFVFFDEVASKTGFELELKDFYDNENMKIFACSSSASIMKEKGGYLTGRMRKIEMLPLDFPEYLEFRSLKPLKSEAYLMEKHFEDYLRDGGIPEYVLSHDPEYLNSLIETIIVKDMMAKHGLHDYKTLNELFLLLCERTGKKITYNRIAGILGISFETAKKYISFFEENFLFYTVEKMGKLNERLKAPKKIYIGDIGLRNAAMDFRDKGALYENLVFLSIKEKKPSYYEEKGIEIDFIYDKTALECKYGREGGMDLTNSSQERIKMKLKDKGFRIEEASGYRFFNV